MHPHDELSELVLVRHAKSDWGDPSLRDHDRPLNARGTRDAPVMAQRFAALGHPVDVILSSTATRARRTAEAFAAALGLEFTLDPELYLASAERLLAKATASGAHAVLLVAHNPGITDLAHRLSDGGIAHMPTCAVARFVWAEEQSTLTGEGTVHERPSAPPSEWHLGSPKDSYESTHG